MEGLFPPHPTYQTPSHFPIPSSHNSLKAEFSRPQTCSGIPFVVSLSLTRKVPLGFSALSSSLSDSRLVILPKYHLGWEGQVCVGWPRFAAHSPGLPAQAQEGPCASGGSGSRPQPDNILTPQPGWSQKVPHSCWGCNPSVPCSASVLATSLPLCAGGREQRIPSPREQGQRPRPSQVCGQALQQRELGLPVSTSS